MNVTRTRNPDGALVYTLYDDDGDTTTYSTAAAALAARQAADPRTLTQKMDDLRAYLDATAADNPTRIAAMTARRSAYHAAKI